MGSNPLAGSPACRRQESCTHRQTMDSMQSHSHNEDLQTGKIFIEWRAPEFIAHEHTQRWYLAWLLGALAAITVAVIFKNFLFALFILLAAIALLLQSQRNPRVITYAITARGVLVGERLYKFEDLESFWVMYEPPHTKELLIASKLWLSPQFSMPIHDANPVRIREILIQFLPEKEQKPSLIDWLIRILKL